MPKNSVVNEKKQPFLKKWLKLNPKGLLKNLSKRQLMTKAAAAGLTVKEYKAKMKKDASAAKGAYMD